MEEIGRYGGTWQLCLRIEALHLPSTEGTKLSFRPSLPQGEGEVDKPAWIAHVFTGGASLPVFGDWMGNCCVLQRFLKHRVCYVVLLSNQRCLRHHQHQLHTNSHNSVTHTHTLLTCLLGMFSGITTRGCLIFS